MLLILTRMFLLKNLMIQDMLTEFFTYPKLLTEKAKQIELLSSYTLTPKRQKDLTENTGLLETGRGQSTFHLRLSRKCKDWVLQSLASINTHSCGKNLMERIQVRDMASILQTFGIGTIYG